MRSSRLQSGHTGKVQRWELWLDGDGGAHSFFPEDNHQAREFARADGHTLAWETTAKGSDDAHRALYAYLDYGQYKPMLRPDGTPYPEDEDDNA